MATHRSPYPSTPPISLTSYGTYHRSELKKRVEKAREAFSSDKESQENCKNYLENNNNYEYSDRWQKGLVPKPLVQSGQYNKSDTFFTDFEKHYPESYILSRSESSYIIGNKASYDTRQYTAEWDPCVYNVVELEDTKIIVEMFEHFGNFWKDPTAIGKVNDRIELAIQLRAKEVIEHLEKDPDTFPERKKAWDVVMEDVERYRKGCAEKLRQLTVGKDGIVFRFQAGTDASIPHLHMHVLASPAEFRKYSTPDHDYKAIPTKMVMEVIKSENEPILRRDIEGDVTTFSHSHNTTAQTQHPHLLNPADQVVLDPHAFVAQWNRDHRDTNNVVGLFPSSFLSFSLIFSTLSPFF
ncbi:hypothetical protein K435DRAFT_432103 [Dendrothele bispora CBS 962.96]|uniref:HIT domain-containing protein n=1 Tax=Dendrothele bispora (strain CBS 962.96) TaxID=1314807 RepID=A0A4S8ME65_DENBC|nr:hypothetical protein K435DRAFT_432103 [Dendrothele bispora CBS 962.96]